MFSSFKHKISTIQSYPNPETIHMISLECALLAKSQGIRGLSIIRTLQLDLCYALIRHYHWVVSPIFEEVLSDFLCQEFSISRKVSSTITDRAIQTFLSKERIELEYQDEESADKKFLEYIFIACATAPDEKYLIEDLGLGTEIISRIKLVASNDQEKNIENESTVEFLFGIDHIIQEIIIEIAERMKVVPWIMDQLRLEYLLEGTNIRIASDRIFQLLLNIGRAGSFTNTQVKNWYENLPSDAITQNTDQAIIHLIAKLEQKELIYEDRKPGKGKQSSWQLSQSALDLTGTAFAVKLFRIGNPNIETIRKVPETWQIAMIKNLPRRFMPELLETIRSEPCIVHPPALCEAIATLAGQLEHTKVWEVIRHILEDNSSPWYKSAICQALPKLYTVNEVAITLKELTTKDPSSRVRKSASLALKNLIVPDSVL